MISIRVFYSCMEMGYIKIYPEEYFTLHSKL